MISKHQRSQAAAICRVMASTPSIWSEYLAGEWLGCSDPAIDLAISATWFVDGRSDHEDWPEVFAEAALLLEEGWSP